ncbi:hypothetical protein DPSP01_011351 [Paraphaeosphaeria sporulosa]|uniref:C3H1-type domain-containing protein n=1 Tax=Paraphaeosphaeria sporulosa TaxID=1460663 RepID=A0A177CMF4_9PLEO|nr:uncharacterized protein CC84DRAFT_1162592 [Paraphaeosphaeria sporulosa]OAG08715.1 hypothetical protein CC84DRAFT_1162592 [Paraphaeosphaeria sporulosa]
MSRPPGPPPYTAEEIALLSTPEAKFKAQAELRSYIIGHKLADLREQGLLGSPNSNFTNTNNGATVGFRRDSTPYFSDTPNADSSDDHPSPPGGNVGPQRVRSRNGERRGHTGYEPYSASQHARSNRGNRSAAWNEINTRSNRFIGSIEPCPNFTATGKCTRHKCPDVHDVRKVALCKRFLYKNVCTKDTLCSLSHDASSSNTPHCLYHLEGRCTNSPCMFIHANIDPNAPVCGSFGRLGYCVAGEACSCLHVYECPEFANNGSCAEGTSCPLRHVHNASRMKAATLGSSGVASPETTANDEEYIGDMRGGASSPDKTETHAITQQHDYVAFESQD